jgi:MFS family permease
LVGVVAGPIKAEFGLLDWQLGLLSGMAFAFFYATLGVPIALYADRSHRVRIIAASATIWSVFTALSGAATNFWYLLFARIGVGVGEAGSSPPSHSILSDLFSPKARTTALAIYSLGVPLGLVLAFQVGGLVGMAMPVGMDWAGPTFTWHMAFILLGMPGLVLAVLAILTIREPQRGLSEGLKDSGQAMPLRDVVKHLWSHKSLIHVFIGATLTTAVGYSGVSWWAEFLVRSHEVSRADLAFIPSLIFGLATGLGIFASGIFTDILSKRDARWTPQGVALAILFATPFGIAVYLMDDVAWVYLLIGIPAFAGGFYLAPSFAMIQSLSSLRMRTVASALFLFVINIVGYSAGPFVPGVISDILAAGAPPEEAKHSMRWALLIFSLVNVWAIFHYWRAGNFYAADLERQRALNAAEAARA